MRCVALFWRRIVKTYRLGPFLLCLFAANGILVTWHHRSYSQEKCSFNDEKLQHRSAASGGIRGLLYPDEATKEFDWKSDVRELIDTIPVVESNLSTKLTDGKDLISFPKSSVLRPLVKSNNLTHSDENMKSILLEVYSESRSAVSPEDVAEVFYDQLIYNCNDLAFLEQRTEPPMLNYSALRSEQQKGKLTVDDKQTVVNVTNRMYEKDLNQDFVKAKETLYKLLTMQGWPGIPRVYAVCLQSKSKADVTSSDEKNNQIYSFRYLVDRYDDAIPICKEQNATDDCIKLNALRKYAKTFRHPAVAVLKIMLNIAEVFHNLWINGIFPYEFHLNELLVTKDLHLVFANVDSFIFLEVSSHTGNSHTRLLSDVMCKDWRQCPTPGWQPHQLLFRLGQHCKEVRGHCSQVTARCWGLDASVYLCTFSKWLFHQLQMLIPSTWHHSNEINQLLSCSYKSLPDTRCDWTGFLHAVDHLIQLAKKEFAGQ